MSLGTGTVKVSGEGPELIQARQEGLHGNPASGNYPQKQQLTGTVTLKLVQWKYLPNPILTSEIK